ncbi:MAG: hypothetical protein KGL35_02770 [Bradyrhizobium sp.]|uniref:hypothetical protein n=1 Tax=Bradyrhizobium sp. TaxID=376 RepID=UPI001C2969B4|nr:hypothetical protein [Bradyrhizobium sp.]MBU6461353.1 hypothetical protein [Pseudomonadota bacterium]MDE2066528.1 hypothetical protein [Bradyrhizobium sp.]MDE2467676.1 hypothetical protein [Bradyrhizobium sp.]
MANVMENAVRVFTLMPKDLQDRLVEIASEDKTAGARFEELSRRILFELARLQYEQASSAMTTSGEIDQQMRRDGYCLLAGGLVSADKAPPEAKVLTVVADVNVLMSAHNANRAGRTATISQRILGYLTTGHVNGVPVQLAVSFKIDTFRGVLQRKGYDPVAVDAAAQALVAMMSTARAGSIRTLCSKGLPTRPFSIPRTAGCSRQLSRRAPTC